MRHRFILLGECLLTDPKAAYRPIPYSPSPHPCPLLSIKMPDQRSVHDALPHFDSGIQDVVSVSQQSFAGSFHCGRLSGAPTTWHRDKLPMKRANKQDGPCSLSAGELKSLKVEVLVKAEECEESRAVACAANMKSAREARWGRRNGRKDVRTESGYTLYGRRIVPDLRNDCSEG